MGPGVVSPVWNNPRYTNDTGLYSGAFLYMTGGANTGENYSINNGYIADVADFIVDNGAGPNAECYVNNTSLDGGTRIVTGDIGTGPGSGPCEVQVYFNGHVEALDGTDIAVNIGTDGCFVMPYGEILQSGLAHPFFSSQGSSNQGGIYIGQVRWQNISSTYSGDFACIGPGPLQVDRIFQSGSGLSLLNGVTNSLVPDYYLSTSATLNSFTKTGGAVTYDSTTFPTADTSFVGSISGTTLAVTALTPSGFFAVGQTIFGSGIASGTQITAFGSGHGGLGTYTVNNSQIVISESMTAGAGASIKMVGTGGGQTALIYAPLTSPHSLGYSFYIKTSGVAGAAATFTPEVFFADSLGNKLGGDAFATTISTDIAFTRYQGTSGNGPVPSGATQIGLKFTLSSGSGANAWVSKIGLWSQ